jgi:hypothetical protein
MSDMYVLDGNGNPVQEPSVMAWKKFMSNNEARRVAFDDIGDVRVSTVFLGVDSGYGGGKPVLWETMIFGGKHDAYQDHYTSRAEALLGHEKAVGMVRPKI